MSRKVNNNKTAMVHIEEINNKGGVRFRITFSLNGKRIRETLSEIPFVKKGTREYKEARMLVDSIAAQRMEELRTGTYEGLKVKSAILLKDWIAHCADKAEKHAIAGGSRNTWARMLRYTSVLTQGYKPDMRLVEVDKAYVRGFINYLINDYCPGKGKEHYAPKTADKYYGCLRFVLNEAKREEIITVNPCELISSNDKIKVPEGEKCYITIEELKKVIAAPSRSRAKNIFLFMCFSGLRFSDVEQLRWENIETEGEEWRIVKVTQKTKKVTYLPLSEMAKKYMPEKKESGLVFNIPANGSMNKALKTLTKNAGIKTELVTKAGRHTFATTLLTQGADIYTVSELLGHSNLNTTRIYAKIVGEKKRKAVDLLNNILD